MTNSRIHLTYEEALASAETFVQSMPEHIAPPVYFDPNGAPECLVSNILAIRGFNPGPEWWNERRDLPEWSQTTTLRKDTHIRFLTSDIFSNVDVLRDALLVRLQVGNDSYKDRRWASILKRAKSYMARVEAQHNRVKELTNG